MPELVEQFTIGGDDEGETVERWTIRTQAVNELVARQKARAWARKTAPNAKNVLTPQEVSGKGETEQSTFNQLMPERLHRETYDVEFIVVRKLRR